MLWKPITHHAFMGLGRDHLRNIAGELECLTLTNLIAKQNESESEWLKSLHISTVVERIYVSCS